MLRKSLKAIGLITLVVLLFAATGC